MWGLCLDPARNLVTVVVVVVAVAVVALCGDDVVVLTGELSFLNVAAPLARTNLCLWRCGYQDVSETSS